MSNDSINFYLNCLNLKTLLRKTFSYDMVGFIRKISVVGVGILDKKWFCPQATKGGI